MFTIPEPLKYDERGEPLEPDPELWAGAGRRAILLNIGKTRSSRLEDGAVKCVLCGGPSKTVAYSFALGNRAGIVPVVRNDGRYDYMAAMQRKCTTSGCGCSFFDYDALGQLPEGLRRDALVTPAMATGELFVGIDLENDIDLVMTKGLGAATVSTMMSVKAHMRYHEEMLMYLEHADAWWSALVARVGDEKWGKLKPVEQRELDADRAIYLERRDAPNKVPDYPEFERLFGILSAETVLDAFKRSFAARYISCCVELQNSSTSRLAIDDTMWVAKLVKMGALTVCTNQLGECVSLMFLQTVGKFEEKKAMLRELGERAARRHDPVLVVTTDDCPNHTNEYVTTLDAVFHLR